LGKVEKLKNDFIERMSRELRTPLNSIIETIISVMTNEHEALSDAGKQSLRSALDDGTGFLRTLQNILDLWRVKQSELPVEIQEVNLRETIDEAIFSVQDEIDSKPLTVETKIDDQFPKIRTDLTKINQILFLLLENAVKFTPGGKVVIAAHLDGDCLRCEIRDTGIGICPDDQHSIFDEFYQVDEPSSQKYAGAGLGLALVRDLIVLLEGEISVQSEIGQGSSFAFELPVQVVS
ncbi:MAG: sensor histidine kinase, partial [Myxococcota bacterium]